MAETKKTDIDSLKASVDSLNLKLQETESAPLDEPEKPKSKVPQRLFAGIGDALQTYASIRQGGPAVQGNIERFLEGRMTERQESREEIKRQRKADIDAGTRELRGAEQELTFARGVQAQQDISAQEAGQAADAAEKDRVAAAEQNQVKIAADQALQAADIAWRKQRTREGFEREDNFKMDAQNQAAAQALDQLIEGDGTSFYPDPETGEQKEIDLTYQVAQGMPYEMFQNRVDRVMLGSGVSPMAEDILRRNADQAWRLAGGSLPGDPQDPVSADDNDPARSNFGRPMIWGLAQGLKGLGAIQGMRGDPNEPFDAEADKRRQQAARPRGGSR